MRTLKVFIEGLTQYLKHQGKTIAGFGTFSELTKSKQKTAFTEAVDEKWTEGVKTTQRDKRLQKKVEQLLELAGFASKVFSAYLCGSPRLCGNDSRKAYKPQSRRGIAEIRREHIRHGQHVLPPSMLLM
jgi:hypothetical protein